MHGVVSMCRAEYRIRRHVRNLKYRRMLLGRAAREGESPVFKIFQAWWMHNLSTAGHEESCRKQGGPPSKAKYEIATDSE